MIYTIKDLKHFPKSTGVYKIYFMNSQSNKNYIGSASGKSGFYGRWKSHISALNNNKGLKALQLACNKYNISNMIFEIIEECDSNNCLIREQYYIDKFNSYKSGYNARPIASNNGCMKMKKESKDKISKKWKILRDSKADVVKKLYQDGKTTREISTILKVGRNFIQRIFKENNIIARNDRGFKKRKIYQYALEGEFINEHESVNKCAREIGIKSVRSITLVLNGKCKHCKNFYYSYDILSKDQVIKQINDFNLRTKIVKYLNIKQVDADGNEIKIWKDIKEIMNFYNLSNPHGVANSIRKNKTYIGFYWRL